MAGQHEPSSSERVKNFLWFTGIAVLIALAILLWIRKSRAPAPSALEKSAAVTEQRRKARLLMELQAAAKLTQDPDEQQRRSGLARIEQLAAQNPEFLPAKEILVRIALLMNENALAGRTANELVKQLPGESASHQLVGLVALTTQQWAEAEAEFRKAIELNQQQGAEPQWELHGLLAEACQKQGKTREADAELRRAADIDLSSTALRIAQSSLDLSERLGLILLVSGKGAELPAAYQLLVGVAKHRTEDVNAQYYAAAAALRAGRLDEAQAFLAAAEGLAPNDPRFPKLREDIARAPTTTRVTSAPATQPSATAPAPIP